MKRLVWVAALAGALGLAWWQTGAGVAALVGLLTGFLLNRWAMEKTPLEPPPKPPEAPAEERRLGEIIASNALLETMMENMREVMLAVDQNFCIIASNRAARALFRQTEEAMTHRRLPELAANSDLHNVFQPALAQARRAEATITLATRIFAVRVTPLRFRRNQPPHGAVGVFFDITKLERLERVRQEFLSNVSHELRTPLTSILAFVETLEDGGLEDAANNRRFLAIIRRNAERMRLLMEDILELSAIEAGQINIEPQAVTLAPLVDNIFAALTARASQRGVTLRHEIAPETIVQADARRLEQMLTNLIDNAIKFNRANGLVTVTQTTDGAHKHIRVTDTGEGIAPEHLPRLFERFYRVDRDRSREMGGTGLGLAIVKHLARAHSGEASATSTLGTGTTFTIELPLA